MPQRAELIKLLQRVLNVIESARFVERQKFFDLKNDPGQLRGKQHETDLILPENRLNVKPATEIGGAG